MWTRKEVVLARTLRYHKGVIGFWVRGLHHPFPVVGCARHGRGRESGGDDIRMMGCELGEGILSNLHLGGRTMCVCGESRIPGWGLCRVIDVTLFGSPVQTRAGQRASWQLSLFSFRTADASALFSVLLGRGFGPFYSVHCVTLQGLVSASRHL